MGNGPDEYTVTFILVCGAKFTFYKVYRDAAMELVKQFRQGLVDTYDLSGPNRVAIFRRCDVAGVVVAP